MGYEMCLQLIDIKIKDDYVDIVNRKLSKHKSVKDQTLKYFLDWAVIGDDGFLCFRHDENEGTIYGPFEDGTALAMNGKWYGEEAIAMPICDSQCEWRLTFYSATHRPKQISNFKKSALIPAPSRIPELRADRRA